MSSSEEDVVDGESPNPGMGGTGPDGPSQADGPDDADLFGSDSENEGQG